MLWANALQTTGEFVCLERYRGDVRRVLTYTHMFVMAGADGRADDRVDPFYTAMGATPEEAEAQAHMVYLRARRCKHQMQRKNPMLLECSVCGIQQRTSLLTNSAAQPAPEPPAVLKAQKPQPKPGRKLFGFLGLA